MLAGFKPGYRFRADRRFTGARCYFAADRDVTVAFDTAVFKAVGLLRGGSAGSRPTASPW